MVAPEILRLTHATGMRNHLHIVHHLAVIIRYTIRFICGIEPFL